MHAVTLVLVAHVRRGGHDSGVFVKHVPTRCLEPVLSDHRRGAGTAASAREIVKKAGPREPAMAGPARRTEPALRATDAGAMVCMNEEYGRRHAQQFALHRRGGHS